MTTIARADRVLAPKDDDESAFAVVQAVDEDAVLVVFPDDPQVPVYAAGAGMRRTGYTYAWRWVKPTSLILL